MFDDSDEILELKLTAGSYNVVRHKITRKCFRTKYDPTSQFELVPGMYDEDGFLLSYYWELPILENETDE